MTPEEISYQRRVRVLELAAELGNVSLACRLVGVSRRSYYEWAAVAELYALGALWPKGRGRP